MKRHQRKRTKGYRTPPNTKYVGRPTKWGNPFVVGENVTREQAVSLYKECLLNTVMAYAYFDEVQSSVYYDHFNRINSDLNELRQYDQLSCFCSLNDSCHVDVLIEELTKSETK